jgi:hypothetical protein
LKLNFLATKKEIFSKKLSQVQKQLKSAFSKVKEEFADHLDAINENTNEIQANYEYLCEIDSKIDKLAERIDEISMLVQEKNSPLPSHNRMYSVLPLTSREQEVFLALYTLEEEKSQVSYLDIGRRLALTELLVRSYITNLIEKGVPIIKKYMNNSVYLNIDKTFKHIQAKENLLGINQTISEKIVLH